LGKGYRCRAVPDRVGVQATRARAVARRSRPMMALRGWRAHQRRARAGGGHLLLVVVLQHLVSRAYCPPPPAPFPDVLIHSPVPPYSILHRPSPRIVHDRTQEHKR
jgi:hypothetical protein